MLKILTSEKYDFISNNFNKQKTVFYFNKQKNCFFIFEFQIDSDDKNKKCVGKMLKNYYKHYIIV